MKYTIESSKIQVREEMENALSVLIKPMQHVIYLNGTASEVIREADSICDVDTLAQHLIDTKGYNPAIKKEIENDLMDTVYLLEAFTIAKIYDKPKHDDCVVVAGDRDYLSLSNFIKANKNNKYNYITVINMSLFSAVSIRARQFNNQEYTFIYREDGEVQGCITLAVPIVGVQVNTMNILLIVFAENTNDEKCVAILGKLLEYAMYQFNGEFRKVRINYFSSNHDIIIGILKKQGFQKVAHYDDELKEYGDLTVYDKVI